MDQIDDILHQDLDPTETQEWVESLSAVINREGTERAHFLLEKLVDSTRRSGGYLPFDPTTEYVNTIPTHLEAAATCSTSRAIRRPASTPAPSSRAAHRGAAARTSARKSTARGCRPIRIRG
jgi:hypothetical protein